MEVNNSVVNCTDTVDDKLLSNIIQLDLGKKINNNILNNDESAEFASK